MHAQACPGSTSGDGPAGIRHLSPSLRVRRARLHGADGELRQAQARPGCGVARLVLSSSEQGDVAYLYHAASDRLTN